MTTDQMALSSADAEAKLLERVLIHGDLSRLSTEDKVRYYALRCHALKLDPSSRPMDYIEFTEKDRATGQFVKKLTLYMRKDGTEQLARINEVSIDDTKDDWPAEGKVYRVTAWGHLPSGRKGHNVGIVSVDGLAGSALANAMMRAETKAQRRLTLSLVGVGMLDESEIDDVPGATLPHATVDPATGEVTGGQVQMDEREVVLAHIKELGDALNLGPEERIAEIKKHIGEAGHGWQSRASMEKLKDLEAALVKQSERKER
jgi:hypothetical protein